MTYPYSDDQLYCVLDYETFSEANIKKVGAYEYSKHPSTEVLCVAWRIGTLTTLKTEKTKWWSQYLPCTTKNEFLETLARDDLIFVAHNAFFEQCISKNVLFIDRPPSKWLCTSALACALSLPRALDAACRAIGADVKKDMEGHRLMLKMSQPRKPSMLDPSVRHLKPNDLERLVEYCVADIDAELYLLLNCPPLTKAERIIWELDQTINMRGFRVDRALVTKALDLIELEKEDLNDQAETLTDGVVTSLTKRAVVLKWLQDQGIALQDMQKNSVENVLKGDLHPTIRQLLEAYQGVSKTSTAKYISIAAASESDSFVRGALKYHAAATGRWSGALVQPHNLPRGNIKDTDSAAEVILDGDLDVIRMLYGNPMDVFSSCIRSTFIPSEGTIFDCADFASIEVRGLFWLAEHVEGVQAFFDNRPIYEEMAAYIFGVPVKDVTPEQRFLGKQAILGCGYMMGWERFQESCASFGRKISDELAQKAVDAYREKHAPVVALWKALGDAAMAAITHSGTVFKSHKTEWVVQGRYLWCRLPSGRRLAYVDPSIEIVPDKYGRPKPTITYKGIDTWTKAWGKQKTYGGKLVENVVQALSRDLMAAAMVRIERAGPWEIVLSVHDELLAERALSSDGTLNEFQRLMSMVPNWAKGLPIATSGWSGYRYKK